MMLHKRCGTNSGIKTDKKLTKRRRSLASSIITVEREAVWHDQAPSDLFEAAEAEAEHENRLDSQLTPLPSLFFGVGTMRSPWNPVSPSAMSMHCESFHSFYDDEESIASGLDPIQSLEIKIAEVTNELERLKK